MLRSRLGRGRYAMGRFSHDWTGGTVPVWEQNQRFVVGTKLLQREALEAKAGRASTVKVEAVVCTTLTARSEAYNRAVLHTNRLEQGRECACIATWRQRCGREKTTARNGDIGSGLGSPV